MYNFIIGVFVGFVVSGFVGIMVQLDAKRYFRNRHGDRK